MSALRAGAVIAAGTAAAALGIWQWVRSHRVTSEERERRRRQLIAETGRICDGTVLDVQEISYNGQGETQLLIYTYDVGGVQYEASQDITHLRHYIDVHSCKLGLPTSIKYDPHNPGNSIVISEVWTGLRT
ncbi:MAG: hypothetical protein ACR2IF_02345 [Terriglobales bacterium]